VRSGIGFPVLGKNFSSNPKLEASKEKKTPYNSYVRKKLLTLDGIA
jgi:hypothetical protein